jgi:hypothetical protein
MNFDLLRLSTLSLLLLTLSAVVWVGHGIHGLQYVSLTAGSVFAMGSMALFPEFQVLGILD